MRYCCCSLSGNHAASTNFCNSGELCSNHLTETLSNQRKPDPLHLILMQLVLLQLMLMQLILMQLVLMQLVLMQLILMQLILMQLILMQLVLLQQQRKAMS